jgi:type I restriction enzyme, S subunit
MKAYPAYKESGIKWIGEIPEHWVMANIGRMMNLGRGRVISNIEIGDNPGEYPVYSSQTAENGVMGYINTYDFEGDYVTWTTDGANAGRVFYRTGRFNCTNVCGTMKPKNEKVYLPFIPYLLNLGTKYYVRYDINPKLMNGEMAQIEICLPPYNEQKAIADFLDCKAAQIDALIEKKQRQIDLLQEQRTALINHAVTKGLNPNAPMKDSGVEWLGEIPSHWISSKIKHLAETVSKGTTPTTIGRQFTDHGIRFIKAENILNGRVHDSPETFIDEETNLLLRRSILQAQDVLIVIAGATTGKVGIVEERQLPANTNQAVAFVRLNNKALARFMFYWLSSSPIQNYVWVQAVQSAQPNLSLGNISNFVVPLPPVEEALDIVSYLDKSLERISLLIQKENTTIELFKEYRTALISEAVTGKIDVRE